MRRLRITALTLLVGLSAALLLVARGADPVRAGTVECPDSLGGEPLVDSTVALEESPDPQFPTFRKLLCVFDNESTPDGPGPESLNTVDLTWFVDIDRAPYCRDGVPVIRDDPNVELQVHSDTHFVTASIRVAAHLEDPAVTTARSLLDAVAPFAESCPEQQASPTTTAGSTPENPKSTLLGAEADGPDEVGVRSVSDDDPVTEEALLIAIGLLLMLLGIIPLMSPVGAATMAAGRLPEELETPEGRITVSGSEVTADDVREFLGRVDAPPATPTPARLSATPDDLEHPANVNPVVSHAQFTDWLGRVEGANPGASREQIVAAVHARLYPADLDRTLPMTDYQLFEQGPDTDGWETVSIPTRHVPRFVTDARGRRVDIGHTLAGLRSDLNRGPGRWRDFMRWANTDGGDSWQTLMHAPEKSWEEGVPRLATEFAPPDQRLGNQLGFTVSNFYRDPANSVTPLSEFFDTHFVEPDPTE